MRSRICDPGGRGRGPGSGGSEFKRFRGSGVEILRIWCQGPATEGLIRSYGSEVEDLRIGGRVVEDLRT